MHSRSLSISLLIASITTAISLPIDQDYQSGTPPTDLNPEILQAMDGPTKSEYFPSGKFMNSGMGPKPDLASGQLNGEAGRPGFNKNPKNTGYSLSGFPHENESVGQAAKTPSTTGHPNFPAGNAYSPFQSAPSYGQNSIQAGRNSPAGHPLMSHERPSASQSTTGMSGMAHQTPSPSKPTPDQNQPQGPLGNEAYMGEPSSNNKLPQRRNLRRELGEGPFKALERRQDGSEFLDGLNAGDDGTLGMGSPFGEFDGNSGGADGIMDDGANPDVLNNALGTGLKRRTSIGSLSELLQRRHNGEDHTMDQGAKNATEQPVGQNNQSPVKQTATNSTETPSEQVEPGSTSKVTSEDPAIPQASEKSNPTGQSGMPSSINELNSKQSNTQAEGLSHRPHSKGKTPGQMPESFAAQFQPQRLSPQDQQMPSTGSPQMNPNLPTGQMGSQPAFMGGKSNAVNPNTPNGPGFGSPQASPFGMGAGPMNPNTGMGASPRNSESMIAEMEDPSATDEDAADEEGKNVNEGQEEGTDQLSGKELESPASNPSLFPGNPQTTGPTAPKEDFMAMGQPI
ncbi:hypothetical protein PGT21_008173 [Puccinia graminis f. sp. tritici]|uniref:Uncharacterized protein n=2 Tax=Puccinia graminis f. sp. tritici TaxID=56615 RepID=E3K8A3_PUCGT|nr:uncharacterized protein PGTG_06677 [Puccinia graminis f. sp. tritici CRL 75-36-700-3]EFP80721.1 hypothetical protein PGTG_06677 [Puccinia graminis f. sp. tritici CRL 75-36-700-3]KAA1111674.1 hypothetical protein PGT21_008173 [Puccinia graminis f. sp. tritici]